MGRPRKFRSVMLSSVATKVPPAFAGAAAWCKRLAPQVSTPSCLTTAGSNTSRRTGFQEFGEADRSCQLRRSPP
jgi:hypothetical protein